jgi:hypothetical protein
VSSERPSQDASPRPKRPLHQRQPRRLHQRRPPRRRRPQRRRPLPRRLHQRRLRHEQFTPEPLSSFFVDSFSNSPRMLVFEASLFGSQHVGLYRDIPFSLSTTSGYYGGQRGDMVLVRIRCLSTGFWWYVMLAGRSGVCIWHCGSIAFCTLSRGKGSLRRDATVSGMKTNP